MGKIIYADDMGHCTEAGAVASKILSFKLHTQKDMVTIITEDLLLAQYSVTGDGRMNLENEQKIGSYGHGDMKKLKVSWINDGILGLVSGSPSIRLLDIFNEENTLLTVDSKCSGLFICP
jgi:intraflagellar transport protein 140